MAAPPQSQFQIPFPFVEGLPSVPRDQIRRNFEELTQFLDALPSVFVVVAADGSGDYTSIKEAIEAQPQQAFGTDLAATIIWVKPSSTAYSDNGAGAVAVGNRRVVVFCPATRDLLMNSYLQVWNSDGLTAGTGETGLIAIHGLSLTTTASEDFLNGLGTIKLDLSLCAGNFARALFGSCAAGHLMASDCDLATTAILGAATTASGPREIRLYNTDTLLRGSSAPPTLTSLDLFEAVGGSISIASGSLSTNNGSNSGGEFSLANVFFSSDATGRTWTIVSDSITITGCGTSEDSAVFNLSLDGNSGSDYGEVSLAGNAMSEGSVTVGANCVASIHGAYRALTLNGSEASAFVMLELTNSGTAVTIGNGASSGDRNFVVAAIRNTGGTAQAVSIGANCNNNVVLYTGTGFGTADSDSGTDNLINSMPGAPTGAAGGDLSGTYPSPSVVDDSHAHTSSTLPATIVYDGDPAGGDLSGTFPNPTVTDDSHSHTDATLPAHPFVEANDTTGATLSDNTETLISWDTNAAGSSSLHSTGTNPSRFIADRDGLWGIDVVVGFAANSSGNRRVTLRLNNAGATGGGIVGRANNGTAPSRSTFCTLSKTFEMSTNDYLEVTVLQDSGGNLALDTAARVHSVVFYYIGPT